MPTVEPSDIHDVVAKAVQRHGAQSHDILNVLNEIQDHFRFIPVDALYETARITEQSFADLCSIVSAFDDFAMEPVGEKLVLVCDGTACHAAGAVDIIGALEEKLDMACGTTRSDGKYTLKSVYCVGACSLAPIVVIDGLSFGHVKLSHLDKILEPQKGRCS